MLMNEQWLFNHFPQSEQSNFTSGWKRKKTNPVRSSFTHFQHVFSLNQAQSAPKADLFLLFYARIPLVCLLLLLMGFLFCITGTNLISAEEIQIRVNPPNVIWSTIEGLKRGRKELPIYFKSFRERIVGGMWVFDKLL